LTRRPSCLLRLRLLGSRRCSHKCTHLGALAPRASAR